MQGRIEGDAPGEREKKIEIVAFRHEFAAQNIFLVFGAIFPYTCIFIKNLLSLSEKADKETMPKENKAESEPAKDTNGEKNGEATEAAGAVKEKLSLGEIAIVDGEIAKAKTEQLQVLHNVRFMRHFYPRRLNKHISLLSALLRKERKVRSRLVVKVMRGERNLNKS